MLETRGMASLMASTDAMLKAAAVHLCGRHGIGSGWLTVVIAGQVADVEAAIRVGEVEANRTGELIGARVVPRPDTRAMDAMPHATGLGAEPVQPRAIGLLETQGLTPLVAGTDAMLKAAQVELGGWAFIGGALCHTPVFGDVAAVQTALEARPASSRAAWHRVRDPCFAPAQRRTRPSAAARATGHTARHWCLGPHRDHWLRRGRGQRRRHAQGRGCPNRALEHRQRRADCCAGHRPTRRRAGRGARRC